MHRYHPNGFKILNENLNYSRPLYISEQAGDPGAQEMDEDRINDIIDTLEDEGVLSPAQEQALLAAGFTIAGLGPGRSLRLLKMIAKAVGVPIRFVLTLFMSNPIGAGFTLNEFLANLLGQDGLMFDEGDLAELGIFGELLTAFTEDDFSGPHGREVGDMMSDEELATMLEMIFGLEEGSLQGQVEVQQLQQLLEALNDGMLAGFMGGATAWFLGALGITAGTAGIVPGGLIFILYMLVHGTITGGFPPGFGSTSFPLGVDASDQGNVIGPGIQSPEDPTKPGRMKPIRGLHTNPGDVMGTYYNIGSRAYY